MKKYNCIKKAFSLIEIMVAMMIMSFVLFGTIKAYSYLANSHKLNEIRYMALRAIDSEMNRLVFHYENYAISGGSKFTKNNAVTSGNWYDYFEVDNNKNNNKFYKNNKVRVHIGGGKYHNYGLEIRDIDNDGSNDDKNIMEIIDKDNNPGVVGFGDIVGKMGWKTSTHSTTIHLSLSITYPYTAGGLNGGDRVLNSINNIELETINIKTSTKTNP